jgi:hypothetical protein
MVRVSNPSRGEIFRTGPGAHRAAYTRDTRSFPEVKRQERVVHPSSSRAYVKKKSRAQISTPPLFLHGRLQDEIYLLTILFKRASFNISRRLLIQKSSIVFTLSVLINTEN